MKKERTQLLALISLLALLAGSMQVVAQEKKVEPEGSKVIASGTFKFLGSTQFLGKVVKGAPYSATAITEHKQTLGDGNQILRKNEARISRDGEGRVRVEQQLETMGKWTADGEPLRLIHINDPVAGHSYSLDPRSRTARKMRHMPAPVLLMAEDPVKLTGKKSQETGTKKSAESPSEGKKTITAPSADIVLKTEGGVARKKIAAPGGKVKIEQLGRQTIEGVEVEGKRSTLTIASGEIGNTLPIEVIDESWYSPELQTSVMTRRYDPRSGESVYRLTNINRSEPDRSLFEVPADYTLKDKLSAKAVKKPRPAKEAKKSFKDGTKPAVKEAKKPR